MEGQFDRVTGLSHSKKTFERERALLSGEWHEPRITTAYLLKDASLVHGYIYKGPMKYGLVYEKEKFIGKREKCFIESAALGCTVTGNNFFSHWMTDNLTLELAAEELDEPVLYKHKSYSHAAEYRSHCKLQAPFLNQAHFESLYIIDDVSQNEYKRKRYEILRNRLKEVGGHSSGHRVMILRGSSGRSRILVNESEIAQHLAAQGFSIVDPQKMSVTEIVRSIQGASLVLGVEGSTMAHGFFSLADGGTILILQPPFRFNALYKEYTDCVGMRFAYVVGHSVPEGFKIDADELDRTLDLLGHA